MVLGQPAFKNVGIAYLMHRTGLHHGTIYRWIRDGYLPTPATTRPTTWPRQQIDTWLHENIEFQ